MVIATVQPLTQTDLKVLPSMESKKKLHVWSHHQSSIINHQSSTNNDFKSSVTSLFRAGTGK